MMQGQAKPQLLAYLLLVNERARKALLFPKPLQC